MTGTLWHPSSGCGPGCLASRSGARPVPGPVRLLRLLGLLSVLLCAAALLPLLALVRPTVRRRVVGALARACLRALQVRVTTRGAARPRRALLVANHVSWLDIPVLLAGASPLAGARLVAKAEVRRWPVLGRCAAVVGTIFIDRTSPRALPGTVAAVRDALAAGERVAVFPEGTTSCGRDTAAFRPAMFAAAFSTGAPVVPVRLRYRLADDSAAAAAAFIGDETLLDSLRRILRLPGLRVEVSVGTAIYPEVDPDVPVSPAAARISRQVLARVAGTAVQVPWPLARARHC